jgi:hypothetical protein
MLQYSIISNKGFFPIKFVRSVSNNWKILSNISLKFGFIALCKFPFNIYSGCVHLSSLSPFRSPLDSSRFTIYLKYHVLYTRTSSKSQRYGLEWFAIVSNVKSILLFVFYYYFFQFLPFPTFSIFFSFSVASDWLFHFVFNIHCLRIYVSLENLSTRTKLHSHCSLV